MQVSFRLPDATIVPCVFLFPNKSFRNGHEFRPLLFSPREDYELLELRLPR